MDYCCPIRLFFLHLHSFVCDAPARAFLKNIKSFTGYHGCERCTQTGKYHCGRMTFPDTNSSLRTDEDFAHMTDEEHHLKSAPSPLVELSIGMVSGFVLDYMHLVCLGVVRRLLLLWLRGPLPLRLSSLTVSRLNENLSSVQSHTPCEFSRKPRSVSELDRWKATEFRQFLLFTGPVVLKDVLPKELYSNFLLLHVAISCLVSPHYSQVYCDFARKLLMRFVEHCLSAYGQDFVVYNVHNLIHLPDDVRRYGPLDNISCFPFENNLRSIKKMVHSPFMPLQQVVNRVHEQQSCVLSVKQSPSVPLLKGVLHTDFTVCNHENAQFYSSVVTKDNTLSTKASDNCVWLRDGRIGRIQHIMQESDDRIFVTVRLFASVDSFYYYPLESQKLKIVCVKDLTSMNYTCLLHDIRYKCMCMPLRGNSFVVLPLHK